MQVPVSRTDETSRIHQALQRLALCFMAVQIGQAAVLILLAMLSISVLALPKWFLEMTNSYIVFFAWSALTSILSGWIITLYIVKLEKDHQTNWPVVMCLISLYGILLIPFIGSAFDLTGDGKHGRVVLQGAASAMFSVLIAVYSSSWLIMMSRRLEIWSRSAMAWFGWVTIAALIAARGLILATRYNSRDALLREAFWICVLLLMQAIIMVLQKRRVALSR